MIIPTVGEFNRDEYVICPRAPASVAELRRRMLERARVTEGSYAYRLIKDLHSAIFIESLDLKADYETYFVREYESLTQYLQRRARFAPATVAALTEAAGDSSGLYHFRGVHTFLTESYGIEFLTRLLEDLPTGYLS